MSLQTLSPKALADGQALCEEVKSHKIGRCPKSVKMAFHEIDGINLFCEMSNPDQPRPMVPKDVRPIIMQSFHALGHPNSKETKRRIAELYYWPRLKTEVEKFVKSCHACQVVSWE